MTIEQCPHCISCDYCLNYTYYYGSIREVWKQAKEAGWLKYKDKHFDTLECMENYKKAYKDEIKGNNCE